MLHITNTLAKDMYWESVYMHGEAGDPSILTYIHSFIRMTMQV